MSFQQLEGRGVIRATGCSLKDNTTMLVVDINVHQLASLYEMTFQIDRQGCLSAFGASKKPEKDIEV